MIAPLDIEIPSTAQIHKNAVDGATSFVWEAFQDCVETSSLDQESSFTSFNLSSRLLVIIQLKLVCFTNACLDIHCMQSHIHNRLA